MYLCGIHKTDNYKLHAAQVSLNNEPLSSHQAQGAMPCQKHCPGG